MPSGNKFDVHTNIDMQKLNTYLAFTITCLLLIIVTAGCTKPLKTDYLYVGSATADITPEKPVALLGQFNKRISQYVHDPLTATVLALEKTKPDGTKTQAMMISCDIIWTRAAVQNRLEEALHAKLRNFNSKMLFINATHTHTAPGMIDGAFKGRYDVSNKPAVMKPSQYADFFIDRVSDAAEKAWKNRKPAGVSWALDHAVVGYNRRVHYFDGSTKMYGSVDKENFRNIEGYQDRAVKMLFFWDLDRRPIGMIVNVDSPSQVVGGASFVSADFWHEVRKTIKEKQGPEFFVFCQCAAAGDQCPKPLIRERAEQQMLKRKKRTAPQEFAARITAAVERVLPYIDHNVIYKPAFEHTIAHINLPTKQPPAPPFYNTDPVKPAGIHILRLADSAIATNPFELYLDYGIRIESRSEAMLTFIVQLSCSHSGYLPTEKAVNGGGYSAENYIVGPEGGQLLVNETVERINALWH